MQSVPSRCGRSVTERRLQLVDSVKEIHYEAQCGIVQGQAGAQPLDAEGACHLSRSELQSMVDTHLRIEQPQPHQAHDEIGVQADCP